VGCFFHKAKTVTDGVIEQVLLCRIGGRLCALPTGCVVETMRPLPIEPIAGAPRLVRGLAIIRGSPVPVLDVGEWLGTKVERATRFVTVKTGDQLVALVVDGVVGMRAISMQSLQTLPPLLREAGAEAIAAIARLDAELLFVLRGIRCMPELLAGSGMQGDSP